MKVIIQAPTRRVHHVLFREGTPFKPKVVKRKDLYQRRPKHRAHGAD